MNCPICDYDATDRQLIISNVPIHCNVLCDSRDEALNVARGDINLHHCPRCTHCFNAAFDDAKMSYSQQYENSLHYSPRFQAYAERLADELIERYALHDKMIVEPGAGQGDFLRLLVTRGGNHGIGYDRSHVPLSDEHPNLRFVKEFLTDQQIAADLIVCRHVLEHVWEQQPFLQTMRRHNTPAFFEVPNMAYTLSKVAIWDLIYEHCHYFTPRSLRVAFELAGFAARQVKATFGDQFLTIDAQPAAKKQVDFSQGGQFDAAAFGQQFSDKLSAWSDMLAEDEQVGTVIWGTGSKGVTFLNLLPAQVAIRYAVDINPRKHGKFVAGSGQEIIAPERLAEIRPTQVIVMNGNYVDEIDANLTELGLDVTLRIA